MFFPSSRRNAIEILVQDILIGAAMIVVIWQLLPYVPSFRRETCCGRGCSSRLRQVALSLLNYESATNVLPAAHGSAKEGGPQCSWRVRILPYMEEKDAFEKYRFDEVWDSPNNRVIESVIESEIESEIWNSFKCSHDTNETTAARFVAIVDPDAIMQSDKPTTHRDIIDGASKTIMLMEVAESDIHWMEPRDLTIDEAIALHSTTTAHAKGRYVAFGDCGVRLLPYDIDPETLRALLTRAGGEEVDFETVLEERRNEQILTYIVTVFGVGFLSCVCILWVCRSTRRTRTRDAARVSGDEVA